MEKLFDLVDLDTNNENCVILKVKEDRKNDLIKLGYFDLKDDMFRVTKGKNHTLTIFKNNGENISCDFGESGYTIISNNFQNAREIIIKCITNDFDIYIDSDEKLVQESLKIQSKEDLKDREHFIELMYWGNDKNDICIHKDNEYYARFNSIKETLKHFEELGYDIKYINEHIAMTGCIVKEYVIKKGDM